MTIHRWTRPGAAVILRCPECDAMMALHGMDIADAGRVTSEHRCNGCDKMLTRFSLAGWGMFGSPGLAPLERVKCCDDGCEECNGAGETRTLREVA